MKTFLIVTVVTLALVKPLAVAIQDHVESDASVAAMMVGLNAERAAKVAGARP